MLTHIAAAAADIDVAVMPRHIARRHTGKGGKHGCAAYTASRHATAANLLVVRPPLLIGMQKVAHSMLCVSHDSLVRYSAG